jgi:hypothetical protein
MCDGGCPGLTAVCQASKPKSHGLGPKRDWRTRAHGACRSLDLGSPLTGKSGPPAEHDLVSHHRAKIADIERLAASGQVDERLRALQLIKFRRDLRLTPRIMKILVRGIRDRSSRCQWRAASILGEAASTKSFSRETHPNAVVTWQSILERAPVLTNHQRQFVGICVLEEIIRNHREWVLPKLEKAIAGANGKGVAEMLLACWPCPGSAGVNEKRPFSRLLSLHGLHSIFFS